jgi:hypothetical protein
MSSEAERLHFACPSCGSKKLWKPEIAGKAARCGCGHVLTVPKEPPGITQARIKAQVPTAVSDDPFEAAAAAAEDSASEPDGNDQDPLLAPAQEAPRRKGTAFVPPPVVIEREEADGTVTTIGGASRTVVQPPNSRMPFRKGLKREEPKEDPAQKISTFRDFVLPAIFIVAGIALCIAAGTYKGGGHWAPLSSVLGTVIIGMVASLGLAVGAVFAASAMGGVAFSEPIPLVIYKLCAVALIPGAAKALSTVMIGDAIGEFNGNMAGVFIGLGCYFVIFFLLFRLPFQDQLVCVLLMLIIDSAVRYMIFRLEGAAAGSSI